MAKVNKELNKLPVKPRINWLTLINTALILGLYIWVLLEKFGWTG